MNKTINLYRNNNSIVLDAFDTVVANISLQRERHGYKTFVLTGCEPYVGTTSTAIELAISLSLTGWNTLLLDADMRKNSAYKRLNENIIVGLADYIRGRVDESSIIYKTNMEYLDYIPCGSIKDDNPLRMLYSQNMSILLSFLRETYDYVIIDVPASNTSVDSHILSVKADATILVVALDGSSRKYLEEARDRLTKKGANIIGVIQNKVSMDAYKEYTKDFDYFTKKKYLHGNHLRFDGSD
ncbi:MAG: CpsD/CapB family tyrosine-protein kinase [Lachnospiraceae bacterium]|nr:CpsD/CapB family tyrosine-protein kinase [Lachnospiraceae bacterium]